MDQILIPFECDCNFDTRDVVLSINDNPVDHQIENNIIIINNDIGMGLNLLEINLISKKENFILKIKDFILNKVSSRQTLYLAFSQLEGKNFCTTWLTDRDNIITIPFGNPMSWWLSECAKKIPNMSYGTNLYDQYTIFYPKSIEIDGGFPRIMQDFMKHNLGFHVVAKTEYENPLHNKKIPYLRVDLDYDEDALFDEFSKNIDLLESDDFSPKQNEYNSREIEKLDLWQISLAVRPNKSENSKGWKDTIIYKQEQFPLLYKLLEQITDVGDGWKGKVEQALDTIQKYDIEKYYLIMETCKVVAFWNGGFSTTESDSIITIPSKEMNNGNIYNIAAILVHESLHLYFLTTYFK